MIRMITGRGVKILAFSGSSRRGSWNRLALAFVSKSLEEAGCGVTTVDLRTLNLPIYDGNLEEAGGVPESARVFHGMIQSHHGFLVASPEYNGSVPALLKNALDWCSRPIGTANGLDAFRGKFAALASASAGPFGGVRALGHLRSILAKMGVNVLPDELLVPVAFNAFDEDGKFRDSNLGKIATALARSLVYSVEAGLSAVID